MGAKIDRAVGLVLLILGLYLLFLRAFGSIAAACGGAFLCCALLRRFRPRSPRMSAFAAGEILNRWALGSDDEAKAAVSKISGIDECKMIYLPRHPDSAIGYGDVFSAWKARRGEEEIVLSAPCRADARARAYARTLNAPRVKLLDAAKLKALIRASDLTPPEKPRLKAIFARVKTAILALPERGSWAKRLLWGMALLLFYIATGRTMYLILALGALFLSGVTLKAKTMDA